MRKVLFSLIILAFVLVSISTAYCNETTQTATLNQLVQVFIQDLKQKKSCDEMFDLAKKLKVKLRHDLVVDKNGDTMLMLAVKYGAYKCAIRLLRFPGDVNARNKQGDTVLHFMARHIYKHTVGLELMILRGQTPPFIDTIIALFDAGANPNIRNSKGETPLMIATKLDSDEMVLQFLIRGADPNIPDLMGVTPLMVAVEHLNYDIAKDLVEHGANLFAHDKEGRSVVQVALDEGKKGAELMACLLIKKLYEKHSPNWTCSFRYYNGIMIWNCGGFKVIYSDCGNFKVEDASFSSMLNNLIITELKNERFTISYQTDFIPALIHFLHRIGLECVGDYKYRVGIWKKNGRDVMCEYMVLTWSDILTRAVNSGDFKLLRALTRVFVYETLHE